ncbi:hypothetical protein NQ317_006522 [Molorchus minor]|uniref:Uncharacterized protein n=1 Tax=Molorchus minor TaxID=1323400 RepID=A0ABQ9IWK1_9CUCU|nr:hypothetical protein NQ317_006522 [Molorchus minor]
MENTFFVRMLYQISLKINEKYGPLFYRLYHSPTFRGKLTRQILCPPMTVYKYDKTIPGSRVSSNLPPAFLTRLFLGAAIFWMLGYSIEFYLTVILVVYFIYKSFKAVRSGDVPVRHNYPTEGFGNISFNDSF